MKAIAHLVDWAGFVINRAAATGIFRYGVQNATRYISIQGFAGAGKSARLLRTNQIAVAPAKPFIQRVDGHWIKRILRTLLKHPQVAGSDVRESDGGLSCAPSP